MKTHQDNIPCNVFPLKLFYIVKLGYTWVYNVLNFDSKQRFSSLTAETSMYIIAQASFCNAEEVRKATISSETFP